MVVMTYLIWVMGMNYGLLNLDKFKLLIEKYKDILNDDINDIILNKYSNHVELKLWHNSLEH